MDGILNSSKGISRRELLLVLKSEHSNLSIIVFPKPFGPWMMVMRSSMLRGIVWLKIPKRFFTDICFIRLSFFVSSCCMGIDSLSPPASSSESALEPFLYFTSTILKIQRGVKQFYTIMVVVICARDIQCWGTVFAWSSKKARSPSCRAGGRNIGLVPELEAGSGTGAGLSVTSRGGMC